MKATILITFSVCGLMINAVQAATFTCKFQRDKTVVGQCPIDTANSSKTCEVKFSNTLQGSCDGAELGGSKVPLVVCAFHDPNIKATDALQILREEKEGAKLATPAGFISGGATVASVVQAFSIGYVEKSGELQLSGGCAR
jgi:hypothetical protein